MSVPAADRFARPVLEAALAQARRDAEDPTGPVPPNALHPYLRFTRVPDRALTAARMALEDDGFRARVAEMFAGDDGLADGLRELLDRSEGWQERFDAAVESFRISDENAASAADNRSARGRLANLTATVERLTSELNDVRAMLGNERAAHVATESERTAALASAAASERVATQAVADRARAVRELKDTEKMMAGKVLELRSAELRIEALAAPHAPADAPPGSVAPDVSAQIVAMRSAMSEAGSALEEMVARLGDAVPPDGSEPGPSTSPRAAGARRPFHRLVRGVVDGTPAAVAQRFALPGVVVFVDGWNVGMQGWPHLDHSAQRQRVIDGLGDLVVRHHCEVHLVFDGVDEGTVATRVGAAGIRVHFTPDGLEADDRILDLIELVDVDRPVVVISNDRRVRRGAAALGAMVLGSTEVVEAMRS